MIETQIATGRYRVPEPGVCSDCGSLYYQPAWRNGDLLAAPGNRYCPACASGHDRRPAGHVHLKGPFLHNHRWQIIHLARHIESREKHEGPMKKILSILDEGDELQITTADMHLAWSIGDAIQHAWQGELDYRYSPATNALHVNWQR